MIAFLRDIRLQCLEDIHTTDPALCTPIMVTDTQPHLCPIAQDILQVQIADLHTIDIILILMVLQRRLLTEIVTVP